MSPSVAKRERQGGVSPATVRPGTVRPGMVRPGTTPGASFDSQTADRPPTRAANRRRPARAT
jgi:hypothetical protein